MARPCPATARYPPERILSDLRVNQILKGTNEIMRVITDRERLKP
jgi:alkylation response protein AidB-like acyl-CoA dehydrogenase